MEKRLRDNWKSPKWQQKIPHAVTQKDKHMTNWMEKQAPPRPRGQRAPCPKISCAEMEAVTHLVKKWWSNTESIWTVIILRMFYSVSLMSDTVALTKKTMLVFW